MNHARVAQIIEALWLIGIVYWLAVAFGNKRTKVRQRRGSRLAYLAVLILALHFVRSQSSLRVPLAPTGPATESLGILLCAAGIFLAIRARHILGRNWSGFVSIKQDHELIQSGPYRFVRHPIYTGIIMAGAGSFLALNPTAQGLALEMVWVLTFYIKSRAEERVMAQEFGERYLEYKRRVRAALIPFLF